MIGTPARVPDRVDHARSTPAPVGFQNWAMPLISGFRLRVRTSTRPLRVVVRGVRGERRGSPAMSISTQASISNRPISSEPRPALTTMNVLRRRSRRHVPRALPALGRAARAAARRPQPRRHPHRSGHDEPRGRAARPRPRQGPRRALIDGTTLIAGLCRTGWRVIVLSATNDEARVGKALSAGALRARCRCGRRAASPRS
jgi:hypothetical protein